jgi:ABC-type Na+ efflux pump permease subunit
MSHHSCSNGTSILKVATGVVFGIWAAKIIPILIIGVVCLAIWLLYLLAQAAARMLYACGDAVQEIHRRLTRRFSPRAAQAFWLVLLTVTVGGMLWAAAAGAAPPR